MAQDLPESSGRFPRRDAATDKLLEQFGAALIEPCEKIRGAIIFTPFIFEWKDGAAHRTERLDENERRRIYATGHHRKIGTT